MANDDLRETTARRMYEERHRDMANVWPWDSSGLDDEHPGVRNALYRDADAAIAVVVEACAQVADDWNGAKHLAHDISTGSFPKQTYMADAIAEAIRALARKE